MKAIILITVVLLSGCTTAELESWAKAINEYKGSPSAICAHQKQMAPDPDTFSTYTCLAGQRRSK